MIECLKELMLMQPMSHEGVYDLIEKTSNFDNVAIVFVKGMIIEFTLGIWVKIKP